MNICSFSVVSNYVSGQVPEHAIVLIEKAIGLRLISCFPCSLVSYPDSECEHAGNCLQCNGYKDYRLVYSPQGGFTCVSPAVRATVSTEASASTCQMGPAAGTSWCLKIRTIPFASENRDQRKGRWKKMCECPCWVENKDSILPLQLSDQLHGGQGAVLCPF